MISVIALLVAVASVALSQPIDPSAPLDPYARAPIDPYAPRAPIARPYTSRYNQPAYNRPGAYVPPARVSYRDPDPVGPPRPYNNAYQVFTDDGGSFSQSEEGDETGAKRGSYTIQSPEGLTRTVDYVADEFGFRATIRTNEPGSSNNSPADVTVLSEAPPATFIQPGPQGYVPSPYVPNPGRYYQPGYQRRPVRAPVATPLVEPAAAIAPVV